MLTEFPGLGNPKFRGMVFSKTQHTLPTCICSLCIYCKSTFTFEATTLRMVVASCLGNDQRFSVLKLRLVWPWHVISALKSLSMHFKSCQAAQEIQVKSLRDFSDFFTETDTQQNNNNWAMANI